MVEWEGDEELLSFCARMVTLHENVKNLTRASKKVCATMVWCGVDPFLALRTWLYNLFAILASYPRNPPVRMFLVPDVGEAGDGEGKRMGGWEVCILTNGIRRDAWGRPVIEVVYVDGLKKGADELDVVRRSMCIATGIEYASAEERSVEWLKCIRPLALEKEGANL